MAAHMQIGVADLQEVCEKLLDHLRELGIETVELSHDFYWEIPEEQRYDMRTVPDDPASARLSDDWHELCKLLNEQSPPIAYKLVWAAAILRAVGERVVR
jgi:hypothetical protein